MFKLIGYLNEWQNLYVSEDASAALRAYLGKDGMREGRDGDFIVTELGYAKKNGERPRLVRLFTLARQPWAELLIGDFLRMHAGEAIKRIVDGGDRESLANEIRSLFKVCEQIDHKLTAQDSESRSVFEASGQNAADVRRKNFIWGIISVSALVITILFWAHSILIRADLRELHAQLGSEQSRLTELRATNKGLSDANKKLSNSISRLTEEHRNLQETVGAFDLRRQQLEAATKGQWTELVEAQIISNLKGKDSGLTRSDIVASVKRNLPAIADKYIEETIKLLVDKGQLDVKQRGFSDYFLLKGISGK